MFSDKFRNTNCESISAEDGLSSADDIDAISNATDAPYWFSRKAMDNFGSGMDFTIVRNKKSAVHWLSGGSMNKLVSGMETTNIRGPDWIGNKSRIFVYVCSPRRGRERSSAALSIVNEEKRVEQLHRAPTYG